MPFNSSACPPPFCAEVRSAVCFLVQFFPNYDVPSLPRFSFGIHSSFREARRPATCPPRGSRVFIFLGFNPSPFTASTFPPHFAFLTLPCLNVYPPLPLRSLSAPCVYSGGCITDERYVPQFVKSFLARPHSSPSPFPDAYFPPWCPAR